MIAGREVRTNTPAPEDVREAVDLLVTQPVAGSFTFGVRLTDSQLPLLDQEFDTSAVLSQTMAVLRATQSDDEDSLVELVPDEAYRNVLLRLVRNIAPDGTEVGEIEIREIGTSGPPTILTRTTRNRFRRRSLAQTTKPRQIEDELRGVLRVIDLNRRNIALGAVQQEPRFEYLTTYPWST